MQAYQVFTGIFIFLVTAGVFVYVGVATYLYRTKALEQEESGIKDEKPPTKIIPIQPEVDRPPKKRHQEDQHIIQSTETSFTALGTERIQELTRSEEQEEPSSILPVTEPSSSIEIEPSKEKEPSEPKTLYVQSGGDPLNALDDIFLSDKRDKKIELEMVFYKIKSLGGQKFPVSPIDYIINLYNRKMNEFIYKPGQVQELTATSEKMKSLFREFQIEERSMLHDVCIYLKNELEGYFEHPVVEEDPQKVKENFKRKTDAFSAYCLQPF